jgi:APA family basic amino acid/polyamine antiporter
VVGIGAIVGCAYLFWSLPAQTRLYFLIWNLVGLALYFVYGGPQAERTRAAAAA